MAYGSHRLLRNLLYSTAVAVTVVAIGMGLPLVNNELPAAQAVPANHPYEVAAGVTVIPPASSGLDVTKTRPGPHEGAALFVVGSIRYAIVVTQFNGTLDEATARLRGKIERIRGYQVIGGEGAITTRQGLRGRQGMYVSAGRNGRYAAFLHDGIDVEMTVAGNDVELHRTLASIEASIVTLTFTGKS